MSMISIEQSYDLYLTTLSYLDEKYFNGPDADLSDAISELEGDSHTFLHTNTTQLLVGAGLITKQVADKSQHLRTLINSLLLSKPTMKKIRLSRDWKTAAFLAKEILIEIHTINGGQNESEKDT
jgi:hypothetical protein